MDELIKRLENATGPDREIDLAILHLVDPGKWRSCLSWAGHKDIVTEDIEIDDEIGDLPVTKIVARYTASIDAALTLISKDWHWRLDQGRNAGAALYRDGFPQHFSVADTPAIALCIAALKARGSLASTAAG